MPPTLELATGTLQEALLAQKLGADRVELCAALTTGGVTPAPGTFLAAREALQIPLFVMVLAQEAVFDPHPDDFKAMLADIKWFVANGADGLVFTVTRPDNSLCPDRNRQLIEAADGLPCTCHRAFDTTPDWPAALGLVEKLGFARLLTAGHAPSLDHNQGQGIATLAQIAAAKSPALTLLPGGGLRPSNVAAAIAAARSNEAHFSLRGPTTHTGYAGTPIQSLVPERIAEIRAALP